jgi:hypothetical protein
MKEVAVSRSNPPQTIISLPVHTAEWRSRARGVVEESPGEVVQLS